MSNNLEALSLQELVNERELASIRKSNNISSVRLVKVLVENIEYFAETSISEALRYANESKHAAEAIVSTSALQVILKHLGDVQKELDTFKEYLEK